jgi:hypothetical protein
MTMQLRADLFTAYTNDGMVLLDERAGRYWQLNPTDLYQRVAQRHRRRPGSLRSGC